MAKDTLFIDEAGLKWHDIANELWRTYTFPGGDIITIQRPKKLHVSYDPVNGDSHRVIAETLDGKPVVHDVRRGWLTIKWQVHDENRVYEF